jgi:hypothetical protein
VGEREREGQLQIMGRQWRIQSQIENKSKRKTTKMGKGNRKKKRAKAR